MRSTISTFGGYVKITLDFILSIGPLKVLADVKHRGLKPVSSLIFCHLYSRITANITRPEYYIYR